MKRQLSHRYDDIISLENLLAAWKEFVRGKRLKLDILLFEQHLMDHITSLHHDLARGIYRHGGYESFNISDPKPRNIHKASVRDRLLHHALYRKLYPFFDRTFIADSYSCRNDKGTHAALQRFQHYANQVSKNHTKTVWALKCDIRKFFANIDQRILLDILGRYIPDADILALLKNIIRSFHVEPEKGLPLGNLTSQLLVNIYMNEFDQYVKHRLKENYYIRYADDFVFLSDSRDMLVNLVPKVQEYLAEKLQLTLHPNKVSISTIASGVDFLGWVHFPKHRVVRTATKRRMVQRIREYSTSETVQSYMGLLQHGNAHTVQHEVMEKHYLA